MTAFTVIEAVLGLTAMAFAVDAGLVGITIAFALAYYVVWPFRIHLVLHHASLRALPYLRIFVTPLFCAAILFVAVTGFQATIGASLSPLARLVASIALGVVVYGVCIGATLRGEVRDLVRALQSMRQQANLEEEPQ